LIVHCAYFHSGIFESTIGGFQISADPYLRLPTGGLRLYVACQSDVSPRIGAVSLEANDAARARLSQALTCILVMLSLKWAGRSCEFTA
jgi:hypothetical protein